MERIWEEGRSEVGSMFTEKYDAEIRGKLEIQKRRVEVQISSVLEMPKIKI